MSEQARVRRPRRRRARREAPARSAHFALDWLRSTTAALPADSYASARCSTPHTLF